MRIFEGQRATFSAVIVLTLIALSCLIVVPETEQGVIRCSATRPCPFSVRATA